MLNINFLSFSIKPDIKPILIHVEQCDKSIWKESVPSLLLSDKHRVSDSLYMVLRMICVIDQC